MVVPPESRVLILGVKPLAEVRSAGVQPGFRQRSRLKANFGRLSSPPTEFKPGQKAKVQLKLTDYAGKPFVGSTVVAIYDKSVEYISGGSNVPEIKEFFWKWRRNHNPVTESNLGGFSGNIVPPNAMPMNDLGVFGGSVADDPV